MSDSQSSTRLRGRLGPTAIVFMVIAAAAPMTVVAASPIGMAFSNGGGVPFNFLAAGIILLLFAVGYTAMANHIPDAGAFYSFVGAGLGRSMGSGAAFLALFTYVAIETAITAFLGFSLSNLATLIGIHGVPWWVGSAITLALVALLGYRDIDLSAKVLGVLLVLEVLVIVVLCVAIVAHGGSSKEGLTGASFTPSVILSGSVGVGIMMAFGGYTGFEATAIFRDEAREPKKTIPRATYAAVIIIGAFYTLASWIIVDAWGTGGLKGLALRHIGDLVQLTATNYVGQWLASAITVLLCTSLFACVMSFHNVIARYGHSLARNGLLPKRLATTHANHGSPSVASVVLTMVSFLLLGFWMALGWDPLVQVFTWISSSGSLGIIILFVLTSVSVVAFFARSKADRRLWNTVIAPALALVGLVVVFWLSVTNFSVLTSSTSAPLNLALALSPVAALVLGIGIDLVLRRRASPATASAVVNSPISHLAPESTEVA